MALSLLEIAPRGEMEWKWKREPTGSDTERIKSLEQRVEDTIDRLDTAVAESQRLSRQLDELAARDPMRPLREALAKDFGPKTAAHMDTYDPDDTVKLAPPHQHPRNRWS